VIGDLELLLIRLEAMQAVLKDSPELRLREIQRWYSRTYHTPLHVVMAGQEVPLEDVLQAFYEDKYGEMRAEAEQDNSLIQEIQDLTETREARQERLRAEDIEEVDQYAFGKLIEEQERNRPKKVAPKLEDLVPHQAATFGGRRTLPAPDLPVVDAAAVPPEIHMVFVSEEEMAAELEGFGGMTQPEKKR
jgi:hypothetical protein